MKLLFFYLSLCSLVFGDTYVVEKGLLTYAQAKANCGAKYGGSLAIIKNDATNNYLAALLRTVGVGVAYIGLEAQAPVWKWHDGSAATYTKWAAGEPNGLRENMGELRSNGQWNDINGATRRASVCFVKGLTMYVGAAKNWNEAEAYCESSAKGWLSKITTNTRSVQMAHMMNSRGKGAAWFGGKQYAKFEADPKTGWMFLDGTPFTFQKWAPNEPNQHRGNNEDCTNLWNRGLWNDLPCTHKLDTFFCDDNAIVGKVATPPGDFALVALETPLNQVWYNSPMLYMVIGMFILGAAMFYYRSKNVKQDPLLSSTTYSSI